MTTHFQHSTFRLHSTYTYLRRNSLQRVTATPEAPCGAIKRLINYEHLLISTCFRLSYLKKSTRSEGSLVGHSGHSTALLAYAFSPPRLMDTRRRRTNEGTTIAFVQFSINSCAANPTL